MFRTAHGPQPARLLDLRHCVHEPTRAKRRSLGTTVELGWADAYRKPIILVMEKQGRLPGSASNVHEHVFCQGLCTYRVDNLDEGIACAKYILMPRLPKVIAPDMVFDGLDDDGNGKFKAYLRASF